MSNLTVGEDEKKKKKKKKKKKYQWFSFDDLTYRAQLFKASLV